jgi:hypothetical protein
MRRSTLTARVEPAEVTHRPEAAKALSSAEIPGTPLSTVASDEMLRIEIQTRDPLVRIIWFVPKGVQLLRPVELLNTPHQGASTGETDVLDFTIQE